MDYYREEYHKIEIQLYFVEKYNLHPFIECFFEDEAMFQWDGLAYLAKKKVIEQLEVIVKRGGRIEFGCREPRWMLILSSYHDGPRTTFKFKDADKILFKQIATDIKNTWNNFEDFRAVFKRRKELCYSNLPGNVTPSEKKVKKEEVTE